MTDFVVWPYQLLVPSAIEANVVPFSRSGGTTLGGLQRVTRTDRGWWEIAYKGVSLKTAAERRMFNALGTHCSGMATPIAIPVWSHDSAEWPAGSANGVILTPHSDGTHFDDGSLYSQPAIGVTMVDAAEIGDTSVKLRIVYGIEELIGVRFSYEHALYKTGYPTLIDGTDWTVPIAPAIRAPIPAGADLEFGLPTCLVRLASDRELDTSFTVGFFDSVDIAFVEAADYWNDLAADS